MTADCTGAVHKAPTAGGPCPCGLVTKVIRHVPPAAVDQLAHAIAKNIADGLAHPNEPDDVQVENAQHLTERLLAGPLAALVAPGTDTSTEDALHRVLDLADELETGPLLVRGDSTAARIRAAVAGPQRDHDEEGS